MWLLVGLGNPGSQYSRNRHNIGFMAVERIAHRHNFSAWKNKFQAEISEGSLGGEKVLLLKPQTYMNLSGEAVQAAAAFYKIAPGNIAALYDELDLVPGKTRIKKGGGSGGHNGIRSIDAHLGPDYWRVRLGIGHPGDKERVTGHVLGDFSKADQEWLDKLLDAVADNAPQLVAEKMDDFMTKVAQAMQPPKEKKEKKEEGQKNGL